MVMPGDFASARYLECRPLKGHTVIIYDIATKYNNLIVSGNDITKFGFHQDIYDIRDISKFDFNGRFNRATEFTDIRTDNEIHNSFQPCIIVDLGDDHRIFFDGIVRLKRLIKEKAQFVRCISISFKEAINFGRVHLDVESEDGQYISIDDERSGSFSKRTTILTNFLKQARPKGETQPDEPHPDGATWIDTVPSIASVEQSDIAILFLRPWPIPSDLPADFSYQGLRLLYDPIPFRKTGDPQHSYHDIILVEFILSLFDAVKILAFKLKKTRKSGYSIVRDMLGVDAPAGSPKSARSKFLLNSPGFISARRQTDYLSADNIAYWRGLLADSTKRTTFVLSIEILKISINARHEGAEPSGQKLIDHCLDLFEWALVAYWRSREWTRSKRRIRQIDDGKASVLDPNAPLEDETVGSDEEQKLWKIRELPNSLLALNGRINPGKIWPEEHHDVLRYEWIIAAGNLNRDGMMVVTPLMAQEYFVVHDFLSTTQKHEFPDWSVFHEALQMAVAQHASSEVIETAAREISADLAEHCLDALQCARGA